MRKNNPFEWSRRLIAYRNEELPDNERQEVEEALHTSPFWRSLYEELSDSHQVSSELNNFKSFDTEKALRKVKKPTRNIRLYWFSAAAAVLIIGFVISMLMPEKSQRLVYQVPDKSSMHSGVTLSLASGEVLDLDTLKSYASDNGLQFSNAKKRLTVAGKSSLKGQMVKANLNRLAVPYGMTYSMVLPDGTQVWLNSGSKLEFPSSFNDSRRLVKFSGEAYFEVAHDAKHPFVVESAGQQVVVLGTAFNLKAYSDEEVSYATLVHGSIAFKDDLGNTSKIKPGEQVVFNRIDRSTEIKTVQTELYTAWKEGTFWFEDAPLDDIMRRVGRWYGLDVVFEQSSLKKEIYSGKMKMYDTVEDVLRKFNKSGGLVFKLDEGVIRIRRTGSNG